MIGSLVFYAVPGKMTRRFAAMTIACQAFVVLLAALVAHGLATANHETGSPNWLLIGLAVAVLCFVSAALMSRPLGVSLGWVVQVATLLAVFVVPVMGFVGLVFLALWVTALVQGHKMDALTRAHLASWQDGPGDEGAEGPPDEGARPADR